MAPLCSNCGGTEFVWAGELKTGGRLGQGPLALRSGGELPLGTRICRGCGHADLFLRDTTILQNPHHWRPNEFVPISSPAPAHHAKETSKSPTPSAPTPPAAPAVSPEAPASAPEPVERPIFVDAPAATAAASPSNATPVTGAESATPADSEPSAKKASKRRSSRPKKSADE